MSGTWTKWVGTKLSMASSSIYIHANMRSSHDYDENYVSAGHDEELCPAVPR